MWTGLRESSSFNYPEPLHACAHGAMRRSEGNSGDPVLFPVQAFLASAFLPATESSSCPGILLSFPTALYISSEGLDTQLSLPRTHVIAEAGLKLSILPQPPEHWEHRCVCHLAQLSPAHFVLNLSRE